MTAIRSGHGLCLNDGFAAARSASWKSAEGPTRLLAVTTKRGAATSAERLRSNKPTEPTSRSQFYPRICLMLPAIRLRALGMAKQALCGFYPQSHRHRFVVHDASQEALRVGAPLFGAGHFGQAGQLQVSWHFLYDAKLA